MSNRQPTDYDRTMGERIRAARLGNDLSLQQAAEMLGCSYQQLQKYENGSNRVPIGRVELMVTVYKRPLPYFFPNATDVRTTSEPWLSQLLANKREREAAKLFGTLSDEDQDLALLLIRQLSERAND